jgi:hypothetical protein
MRGARHHHVRPTGEQIRHRLGRPHDIPTRHAEQVEHAQMLARLRPRTRVSGDVQQHPCDAAHPGHHGREEAFVSGHIDDADPSLTPARIGEAEIDGHAAPALLGQPVGLDAG